MTPFKLITRCLASCLLTLLCYPCFAVESQVMVATWELKQQVNQLRQDISTQQGGLTRLLDRCSILLQEHPDHLIQNEERFSPIQDVLMADLRFQGLLQAWIEHVDATAQDLLKQAQQSLHSQEQESALRNVAQRFPETSAAAAAWNLLADMAWDRGHLGSYLFYALRVHKVQAHPDAPPDPRLEAAQQLLSSPSKGVIPTQLDRIDSIWEEELPVIQVRHFQPAVNNGFIETNRDNGQLLTPYQLSHGNSNVLVLSNGINMLILDPLLGRQLGQTHNMGNNNFGTQSNSACVSDNIIVAIGADRNGVSVLACDHIGQQLWRKTLDNSGATSAASRPIILDNTIFISVIENNTSSERIDLVALDLSGNELWRKVVAQVTTGRAQYQRVPQDLSPDLCIHRGRIALLSNRGVIAQIASDGSIMSLDSYPVNNVDMRFIRQIQAREGSNGNKNRLVGQIRSDGRFLVAAPIDSNIILSRDGEHDNFVIYKGDGQAATLLDVHRNQCLIIDDKIRLLDLTTQNIRWEVEQSASSSNAAWGRLGETHCLIAAGNRMSTHLLSDGRIQTQVSYPEQQRVSMHKDLMVFIGDRLITGRGDSLAFEEILSAAAAKAPLDPQPRIALAALRRAQGKSMEAFDFLLKAIELGAPNSYSENAAQMLRPHLYLNLNNEQFALYRDQMKRLLSIDPQFAQELDWWHARRAEYKKDIPTALRFYQSMQRPSPRYITFANRLQANLNSIAQASINRLSEKSAPWAQTTPSPKSQKFAHWKISGSSPITPLATGSHVIAFINGFLRCYDASTGAEIWKQNTEHALPMLGVSTSPTNQQQNNAQVVVLNGMTADIIGMQHNDIITKFNDITIHNWPDIIKAVSDIGCGKEFTITVQRGEAAHTFSGVLGAKPMQATQANQQTVMCQNIRIRQDPRKLGHFTPTIDTTDTPYADIYDLASGELLWHHTINTHSFMPILTDNDLLLESQEADLVALDVRDPNHPIKWTAKGRGHELNNYTLHGDILVSIDNNTSQTHIRNMLNGELLFSIPCNPKYEIKLLGDQFVCTLPDGHLALWQLSTGDMLWTSQEVLLKPLAASATSIYCRTSRDELISVDRTNGSTHRRYPQWTQVFAQNHNDNLLFLACVNLQQDQTIAAIHLKSGNVTWEYPFSSDLQFNNIIIPNTLGAYFKLSSDDERYGFVHILNEGQIQNFIPVDPLDSFCLLGQQLVTNGNEGLTITQADVPNEERTVSVKRLNKAFDNYSDFVSKQLDKLKWTSFVDNEFAIIRNNNQIHFICKFSDENQDMRLRLGLAGSLFDNKSALIVLKSQFAVNLHIEAGWQLTDQCELTAQDGKRIRAFSLQVPLLETPALPILMHVSKPNSSNNDIWWLRKFWYRLQE